MPIFQEISDAARRIILCVINASGTYTRVGRFVPHLDNDEWPAPLKRKNDLHVLVVEDDTMIGMLIEDILAEFGCHKVEVVASVESALDTLAGNWPDFAILDVNLNGLRSYPVADFLKSHAIPFIFMSGYGSGGLDRAYAGAKVLQKPFRPGDLEMVLDETFSGSPLALGSC